MSIDKGHDPSVLFAVFRIVPENNKKALRHFKAVTSILQEAQMFSLRQMFLLFLTVASKNCSIWHLFYKINPGSFVSSYWPNTYMSLLIYKNKDEKIVPLIILQSMAINLASMNYNYKNFNGDTHFFDIHSSIWKNFRLFDVWFFKLYNIFVIFFDIFI